MRISTGILDKCKMGIGVQRKQKMTSGKEKCQEGFSLDMAQL